MNEHGYEEGSTCGRRGCAGVIRCAPVEDCSCHISPPCGACTSPREYCDTCDWEAASEVVINDHVVQVDRTTGVFKSYELRPLDKSKIDWHSKSHTHFSMIKEGVYPDGVTMKEVEDAVRGTFGGRFDYFGNGKFKYVAYTD